jgi:hypothetical protein
MQLSPITGCSAVSDETIGEAECGYETAIATAVAEAVAAWQMSVCCRCI